MSELRFMGYNILDGGLDASGASRRDAIAAVIDAQRPDVLVLCECNGFEDDDQRAVDDLERRLDMRGRLLALDSGYHLALFVRDVQLRTFEAVGGVFHHGAFVATIGRDGREMTLVGTHLCPFSGETRLQEARQLASYARGSALLVGDLNSLSAHDDAHHAVDALPPRYRTRHLIAESEQADTRALSALEDAGLLDLAVLAGAQWQPTRPTQLLPDRPRQRLDYLLATEPVARSLRGYAVIDHPRAQRASDHLPVIATLDW